MTINELIVELQRRAAIHGGDQKVKTTSSGFLTEIDLSTIYYGGDNESGFDRADCLIIDADGCRYKEDYQHPDDIVNNLVENGKE